MSVWKAPEDKQTKDGRKYFFMVSYKTASGESKRYHSKKYFTKIDETLNTYGHFYRNTLEGIVDMMDEKLQDFNIEI